MENSYMNDQLSTVCPLPLDGRQLNGIIRVKFKSEKGETNWLNITHEQMSKIELILDPEPTNRSKQV